MSTSSFEKKVSGAGVDETIEKFQKLTTSCDDKEKFFEKLAPDNKADIMSFVEEKWNLCYGNGTLLQPLYPSEIVQELCYLIASSWIRMEVYIENGMKGAVPTSSGENILITGSKGVGKTTLMIGLYTIIKIYGLHVKPIYLSFDEKGSCSPLSSMLKFDCPFTTVSFTQWTKAKNQSIILFGDEFDSLYEKLPQSESIGIAQEILSLGKSTTGFGVISGSSAALRALVYKLDPLDDRHKGFPNLNHTVYVETRLMPVRDPSQLEKVLRINGQVNLTSESNVKKIFSLTGGVGRRIACIRSIDDMEFSSSKGIPNIKLYISSDTTYGSIIRELYVKNKDWKVDKAFDLQGLSLQQLIAHSAAAAHPTRVAEILLDAHILHLNASTNLYEFLYPQHISILADYYEGDLSRLELLALETTVKGWEGFGSAGQVLEPLILRTLVGNHSPPFEEDRLTFSGCVKLHVSGSVPVPAPAIGEILDKVMAVTPDKGLDSVYFTEEPGDATTAAAAAGRIIEVHVSQIKLGQMGKMINLGTSKSSDASSYFTAILKKAEIGWAALNTFLSNSYPGVTFILKSFALITNKKVEDLAKGKDRIKLGGALVDLIVFDEQNFQCVFEKIINTI